MSNAVVLSKCHLNTHSFNSIQQHSVTNKPIHYCAEGQFQNMNLRKLIFLLQYILLFKHYLWCQKRSSELYESKCDDAY